MTTFSVMENNLIYFLYVCFLLDCMNSVGNTQFNTVFYVSIQGGKRKHLFFFVIFVYVLLFRLVCESQKTKV